MMILYKSLIASYLNYGLLLWGTESHKVLTLQKKAIRLISNSSYISHTNPLFIQHKLLKIGDLFKLKLLNYITNSPTIFYHPILINTVR